MFLKFSNLDLLSAHDLDEACDSRRLGRLRRNRAIRPIISGLLILAISGIPGTLLYKLAAAPVHPVNYPVGVKWGLVLAIAPVFFGLVAMGILFLRHTLTDPIAAFLRNPTRYHAVEAKLLRGELPMDEDDGRRTRTSWSARIRYTVDLKDFELVEGFDPNVVLAKSGWRRRQAPDLASLLPVGGWVIHRLEHHWEDAELRRFRDKGFRGLFFQDVRWFLRELISGSRDALIALDSSAIEKIPRKNRKSHSDVLVGCGLLAFSTLVASFFFVAPRLPDNERSTEIRRDVARLKELEAECASLKRELDSWSPSDIPRKLEEVPITNSWLPEIQHRYESLDSSRLSPEERRGLTRVFFADCREKILARLALQHLSVPLVKKVVLYWLNDIVVTPRSVARLEMARDLLLALLTDIGSEVERKRLREWTQAWSARDPGKLEDPIEVMRWIWREGNAFKDWYFPVQARVFPDYGSLQPNHGS